MIVFKKSLLVKEMTKQVDLVYFKHYFKMAIYKFEKQAFDTDPKAMQQINFTSNLDQAGNTTMFLLSKKQNKFFSIFDKELWD